MRTNQGRVRGAAPRPENVMRTVWKESLSFCGPYPVVGKRFFKLETLVNALEKALMERDRFLHAGLQSLLGASHLASLESDLVYEDASRLVFSLSAANRLRKRALLRLVVAKNHEECSVKVRTEFETMQLLHQRVPEFVLAPHRLGNVFLPDRHHRTEVNREVFAYLAEGSALAPLYVASSTQLGPREAKPRRFSAADTEALKASLVRLLTACYDPRSGVGLDPGSLSPEFFTARIARGSRPELLLMHCGRLRKGMRPAMFVRHLLFSTLRTGDIALPAAPAQPALFLKALSDGASAETARAWCRAFFARRGGGGAEMRLDPDSPGPGREYLSALEELAMAEPA